MVSHEEGTTRRGLLIIGKSLDKVGEILGGYSIAKNSE